LAFFYVIHFTFQLCHRFKGTPQFWQSKQHLQKDGQQDFGPSINPKIHSNKKGQLTLAKNRNTKRQKNKRRKKVLKKIILLLIAVGFL